MQHSEKQKAAFNCVCSSAVGDCGCGTVCWAHMNAAGRFSICRTVEHRDLWLYGSKMINDTRITGLNVVQSQHTSFFFFFFIVYWFKMEYIYFLHYK